MPAAPAAPAAHDVLLVPRDATARAERPFSVVLPALAPDAAVCLGLAIDWRHQDALRSYAMQHTLPDEHARAARFPQAEDGLRNLLGRALLRTMAAHYGGMDPNSLIRVSTWGKPELEGCSVGCNISHAGNQLWVAVASSSRVGIDVASASAGQEYRDIAAGFHPDEVAALRRATDGRLATMRCWNRKEAVSKATGLGLSLPLRDYAVDCGVTPSHWLRLPPPRTARSDWTTVDLPVGDGYVGALAVAGRIARVDILRLRLQD
ncbi:MAG TPA: 4'-phosphopantetheinyl transferase superfamily protein [Noviherbaspirillum sp.]|uniref:4'-phosphopantetheinyl transferase family protein n=1 Tax=Noviherbaspirillum sp. TaxID=1926288 RepID=UPI002F92DA44